MPTESGSSFRVRRTSAMMEKLRRWGVRAQQLGVFASLASLLTEIETSLMHYPTEWGDPFRNLRYLNMVMYRKVLKFIVVEYAVNEEARVVFISDYRLLAENPLGL